MLSMLAQGKLYVGTRTELYTIGIGPLVGAGWGSRYGACYVCSATQLLPLDRLRMLLSLMLNFSRQIIFVEDQRLLIPITWWWWCYNYHISIKDDDDDDDGQKLFYDGHTLAQFSCV